MSIWANGQVTWDFKEGGQFALFGGNATGTFTKIVSLVEFSRFFKFETTGPEQGDRAEVEAQELSLRPLCQHQIHSQGSREYSVNSIIILCFFLFHRSIIAKSE